MEDWDETNQRWVGGYEMVLVCGYSNDGGETINPVEEDTWFGGIKCHVPCPKDDDDKPCDPNDPGGLSGGAPFDPETQCCEDGKVVKKVKVHVVNRSDGQRTGLEGHIDLVIPDERVGRSRMVGFYGIGPDGCQISGVPAGSPSGMRPSGGSGISGMGLEGYVNYYDDEWFRDNTGRANYARGEDVATICEVMVCPRDAGKMLLRARDMWRDPDDEFNIVGGNCASGAANILAAGGVLSGEIGGLDTPEGLQDQLALKKGARCYKGRTFIDESGAHVEELGPPPEGTPFPWGDDPSLSVFQDTFGDLG